jgi:hypothetical protein
MADEIEPYVEVIVPDDVIPPGERWQSTIKEYNAYDIAVTQRMYDLCEWVNDTLFTKEEPGSPFVHGRTGEETSLFKELGGILPGEEL